MSRLSTIELFKERLSFSAGHFTILSKTKRERIHGHNYQIYCALTTAVSDNGMTFDYRDYKNKLYNLCRELNEVFLIPGNSPHIEIAEDEDHYYVHFHQQKIPFLKWDVKILPVVNITVEELSQYILNAITQDKEELKKHALCKIVIKVSSSPGQYGSATWEN